MIVFIFLFSFFFFFSPCRYHKWEQRRTTGRDSASVCDGSVRGVEALSMPQKKPWWASCHASDPCGMPARLRACERGKDSAPPWASSVWPCFAPLTVRAGDWLSKGQAGEKDRKGQTLNEFLRPGPHRQFPSRHCHTIYLVPVGDVSQSPPFELLAECVSAHFGLPVKRGKALGKADLRLIRMCDEGSGYGPQLEAPDVTRVLRTSRRERDAFVVVGYTMHDLCCSDKGFDFLFGQANADEAAGIFSFARYSDDAPSPALLLRRCCMVLCHEIGYEMSVTGCESGYCGGGIVLIMRVRPNLRKGHL